MLSKHKTKQKNDNYVISGQASISTQGLDLLNGLLALDPAQRTSASDALGHWWFTSEKPAPTPVGEMPQVRNREGGETDLREENRRRRLLVWFGFGLVLW